ncbi:EDD domain protein, DegV family [Desulfitobacterium dichloroeliminans LMG P-21439]|uniref:EDD domain protein, DegV family n=1 Tax=Desulfitobacterium dichloroeliminans (strain LMG P-21439 / DCA1) TaxID=871963 RepID=L0F5I1_DESDL|nr:DegV family protein [Desulfitobacterium dichloroeliminans]AGA69069.1 EDD domain protein, DegV family [Desulfitobacterium dichloroeliminans LMG P-21439]
MAVRILTDSTSYIDNDLRKELDIRQVSLNISFGEHSMREIDVTNEDFYQMMEKEGIPTSSQPSIGEFYLEMEKVVAQGDSLCGIFISSDMSGTYSTALLAKEMVLEKYADAQIEIMDAHSNSMQLGFAVLQGARAAQAKKSLAEVKGIVLENIKRSRFVFVPDNLDYLKKGGRIGGASALIGNLFKIIPILTVEEGKVVVLAKVRHKEKAILAMMDKMFEDIGKYGLGEIAVHHINCLDEAQSLVKKIKEKVAAQVKVIPIGPVIGLHVGPGAVGIVYYTEKDLR